MIHGSSDPRPWKAANALAEFFAQRIRHVGIRGTINEKSMDMPLPQNGSASDPLIGGSVKHGQVTSLPATALVSVATLEKGNMPLHQQIEQFGRSLLQHQTASGNLGPSRLRILPLFLLKGMHVVEDIPAEISRAQELLGRDVAIEVAPYLGSHPGLARLVVEQMASLPVEAWIFLAHGSQRQEANQAIETLAERLGAVTAYWSMAPNLETRLHELRDLGLSQIAVFPYFLFSGGITDAIAQIVDRFAQQHPSLKVNLIPPFNAAPEIADLLIELAEDRVAG